MVGVGDGRGVGVSAAAALIALSVMQAASSLRIGSSGRKRLSSRFSEDSQ